YSAEIGYWIAEDHWGRGIGTEAVTKMTVYVFSEMKTVKLSAPVYSPNKASMRVLEKCGYTLEAIHRKAIFKNDEFLDEHVFVKFRS
ncbi:MAG: GNAT family N-acetyltransferase, partial [Planctomycetota bacterium]